MNGPDLQFVAYFAFVIPSLYGAVGAWLSRVDQCEGAWDEFFSAWPFMSIGCFVGALSLVNSIH
jgi:hypothetical protein